MGNRDISSSINESLFRKVMTSNKLILCPQVLSVVLLLCIFLSVYLDISKPGTEVNVFGSFGVVVN